MKKAKQRERSRTRKAQRAAKEARRWALDPAFARANEAILTYPNTTEKAK